MAKVAYETIVGHEDFDYNDFKQVVKDLNDSGLLEKKVNFVGKKEVAVKAFLDAVERFSDEDVRKMPDAAFDMNNNFIDILENAEADGEESEGEEEGESEGGDGSAETNSVEVENKQKKKKEVKNKKAQKEKKPFKKKDKSKYTRSNALVESLPEKEETKTRTQMVNDANQLYIENGGNDNLKVAKALLNYVMPSLLLLRILTKDKEEYKR